MSERPHKPGTKSERTVGDDQVAALLRVAGRREPAPAEAEERVRARIHREWHRALRARRRRAWAWSLGSLAAAAAVAVVVGLVGSAGEEAPPPAAPPPPAATAEVVLGPVTRKEAGDGTARPQPLAAGDRVAVGSTVESPVEGRAALRLANGASLRLGAESTIRFASSTLLVLDRGRLYVDSEGPSDPLAVRTPLGLVQELGTQFEVRSEAGAMRVRVREGAVVLDRDGESFETAAGGELTVGSDGDVVRRTVSAWGEEWSWVLELAPSFDIEGRRLGSFLDWARRETGWEIRFAPVELESEAASIVLHGSTRGLRPDQALEAVLPTCGLVYELSAGVVEIARARVAL